MKSSSVVSLGRNVTVSWTKFRTAMRISNPSGGDRTGTYYRGPRQGREAVRSNVDGPAVEKWRSRHGTHPDRSARHEGPAAALHPGWRVGNTIYVAGQLPYDKDG